MSSRVVRSRFAIASRYVRTRSASTGGPPRAGSLAASCATAADTSTQPRVASERNCLMGRLLPYDWWPDRKPLVGPRTLPRLPLPGGEVEVVPPGGDLPVADLEHAGAGERDPLLPEAETVDALREDQVPVRREV